VVRDRRDDSGRRAGGLGAELAAVRRDRRFSDPSWERSWLFRRLLHAYLALGGTVDELIVDTELDRGRPAPGALRAGNVLDALAPTSFPWSNPPVHNRRRGHRWLRLSGPQPIACGLLHIELSRGDGSLGTFLGVQAGLAMQSIAVLGSEKQKRRWLPLMARLDPLGAFALTKPDHGSGSVALETTARRDGDMLGERPPARQPRHPPHSPHQGHPHLRRHRDRADPHRRARHHRHRRIRLGQRP
jgi:hypothetical protein